MMTTRILLIDGRPNPDSHTGGPLNEMIRVFETEGIGTDVIRIGNEAVRGCTECGKCAGDSRCVFTDDPVNEAAAKLETADGLIVISPLSWNSPTGTVISFMDRLFRCASFPAGRKVGACLICSSENEFPARGIDILNQYFAASGMKIASVSLWEPERALPEGETSVTVSARNLARRMCEMVKTLAAAAETGEKPDIREDYVVDFTDGDFAQLRKRPVPMFFLDDREPVFPDPRFGNETGLLAVGGEVSVEWLIAAYRRGIFPWCDDGSPLMWFCPKNRFVLLPENLHISKKMKQFMRNHDVRLEMDRDFADTMHHCRTRRENTGEETWITDEVEEVYLAMRDAGHTFSAEAFTDGELAGGLYGIRVGRCLMGESMFSLKPDGSKLALTLLLQQMEACGDLMVDCQEPAEYLIRMGGKTISYDEYMRYVNRGLKD